MNSKELAYYFDHTYLKAFATEKDMDILCQEALDYGFHMVAINSFPVSYCHNILKGSKVHVGAAIAFPLGQMTISSKLQETENAIHDGADEIDYVVNIGKVKEGNYEYIEEEMQAMVDLCRKHNILIKVIFENCYLEKSEIKQLAIIASKVKPDFIKTSTGFGTSGATVQDIRIMKENCGKDVQVKAAGGIRDLKTCLEMIEAGATRIGSSKSVEIVKEFENQ